MPQRFGRRRVDRRFVEKVSLIFTPSPVGILALQERDGALVRVAFVFGRRLCAKEPTPPEFLRRDDEPFEAFSRRDFQKLASARYGDFLNATPLLERVEQELREYFDGTRTAFDLPLNPQGTEFQRKVWRELTRVPYGTTETYGGLARRIGTPKAARAVGTALRENPIGIIAPCHRVLSASGGLGGFNGGLERKKFLLQLEREVLARDLSASG